MDGTRNGRPLVIGVGNRYRRDDGVGLAVAARLGAVAGETLTVAAASGEGAGLLDLFAQSSWVVVVDAVASGAPPGTIFHINASAMMLRKELFRTSTHAFGVAETVELARALRLLPARLIIVGLEGAVYGAGEGLSPAVERAVGRAVDLILEEARMVGPQLPRADSRPLCVSRSPGEEYER